MLLSPLQVVAGDNGLYFDVKRIIDMDWNDTTHEVHTEFVPSNKVCVPDRTLLTILTKETIKEDLGPSRSTLLSVSVLLGHYHTEYHTRYIPLEWNLDLIKTKIYDQREYHLTGGAAIATLRALTIQLGVPLAVENKYIDKNAIDKMHTYVYTTQGQNKKGQINEPRRNDRQLPGCLRQGCQGSHPPGGIPARCHRPR